MTPTACYVSVAGLLDSSRGAPFDGLSTTSCWSSAVLGSCLWLWYLGLSLCLGSLNACQRLSGLQTAWTNSRRFCPRATAIPSCCCTSLRVLVIFPRLRAYACSPVFAPSHLSSRILIWTLSHSEHYDIFLYTLSAPRILRARVLVLCFFGPCI